MDEMTVLLTGDYWHADFADLIARAKFAITLRAIESILADEDTERHYRLVVVASSRRGQFDAQQLEQLVTRFANVPIVVLLGSWCEGEERSGSPAPGLIRVYWHQWLGRMDRFIECVERDQVSSWQLPKIATVVDRVIQGVRTTIDIPDVTEPLRIGISSNTEESYLMLREAFSSPLQNTIWIEGADRDVVSHSNLSVICVEANSLNELTQQRLLRIQQQFPIVPIVLTLNFPRRSEYEIAARLGISEIVSKPFLLTDLQAAVVRSLSCRAA